MAGDQHDLILLLAWVRGFVTAAVAKDEEGPILELDKDVCVRLAKCAKDLLAAFLAAHTAHRGQHRLGAFAKKPAGVSNLNFWVRGPIANVLGVQKNQAAYEAFCGARLAAAAAREGARPQEDWVRSPLFLAVFGDYLLTIAL